MTIAASRFNDSARLDIGKPDYIRLATITESLHPMHVDLESDSYLKAVSDICPIETFGDTARLGIIRLDSARLDTFDKACKYRVDLSSDSVLSGLNGVAISGTIDISSDAFISGKFVIDIGGIIALSSYVTVSGEEYTPAIHNLYFDETARLDVGRLGKIRLDNFVKTFEQIIELESEISFTGRQLAAIAGTVDLSSSSEFSAKHWISVLSTIDLSSYAFVGSGFSVPIGATLDLLSDIVYSSVHAKAIANTIDIKSQASYTSLNRKAIFGTVALSSYSVYSSLNRIVCTGTLSLSSELEVLPLFRYTAIEIEGPFEPGETILIDSNTFAVTLDGENILDRMTGDFPTIIPGTNEIRYIDDETARTVAIRVIFSERVI